MGADPPGSAARGGVGPRCGPSAACGCGPREGSHEGCEGVEVWERLQYGKVRSASLDTAMRVWLRRRRCDSQIYAAELHAIADRMNRAEGKRINTHSTSECSTTKDDTVSPDRAE